MTLPPTSVHVIVWCGDTPVVLRPLGDRCERHKRASRAWSARWPASPKGRIESEPRGPSQLRGVRGVARIAPSQLRIVTIRHGLKVFVLILPCFGHLLASHFRARMHLPKKSPTWNPASTNESCASRPACAPCGRWAWRGCGARRGSRRARVVCHAERRRRKFKRKRRSRVMVCVSVFVTHQEARGRFRVVP